jgi:murein L,D-transpeptidase YcbB/YkuD
MPRLPLPPALVILTLLAAPPAASEPSGEGEHALPPGPRACAVSERLASPAAKPSREEGGERAALVAFYDARRCEPLWVADGALNARGKAAIAEIADSDAWGLDPSAFRLPATREPLARGEAAEAEALISLAVLKYARFARGGRAEPSSLSRSLDRPLRLPDPQQVIREIAEAEDAAGYLSRLNPQHPQFEALRQAYLSLRRSGPEGGVAGEGDKRGRPAAGGASAASLRKLLVNMEEWRWMPEDLGAFYVWVNVPEFMLRVVKNGQVIHAQRVVVGKADKPTPIFSANLEQVIFHPTWGVPDSIKIADILPSLLRGSSHILERHNLRVQRGGRDIDPASVDWASVDLRSIHIYQPPGDGNVLGNMKFRFPNKHDVYMHDTPDKYLFKAAARAFSHGCMRLSEPDKLAELVLDQDQGWTAARVAAAVRSGPQNNAIGLQRPIPVHVTYFTAAVEEGKLVSFADVYGHEARIALGIEGKAYLIAKEPAEPTRAEVIGRLSESRTGMKVDWAARAFGNN